jgi:hypothetical protein
MSGIDRRTIMVASGAVMLASASGCKPGAESPIEPMNHDGLHGLPSDKKGTKHFSGANDPKFEPSYVCLVYMKFNGTRLNISHAYYAIAGYDALPTDAAKLQWVKERLASAAKGQWSTTGLWPAEANHPNPRKNFDGFHFGSQQRIFFLIDNGSDIIFDRTNSISFTPYSAKIGRPTDAQPNKKKADPNSAFFSAEVMEDNLLYLENWFTSKKGKKIEKNADGSDYAEMMYMNIHLLIKSADGTTAIPVIIDPDTGNGTIRRP